MKNLSFLKKIRMFLLYKKTLKKISKELEATYNIRIDEAFRMYTVVNINTSEYQDIMLSNQQYDLLPKNMEDEYIDSLYQKYMKEFTNSLSNFLNSKGLSELYNFYQIEKINKFSYLVVFGFSLFKSDEFYKTYYNILQICIASIVIIGGMLLFVKWLDSPY
jgi:hypothetical protein